VAGRLREVLAGALVAALREEGIEPHPGLRLLDGATATRDLPPLDGPAALGTLHERSLALDDRARRGAWYTPSWLAAALVERAVPDAGAALVGPVVDLACGGGAILLAAADRLRALGWAAGDAVRHLRGFDVDPLAVAVTEAALWWWSARLGEPALAGERVVVGDGLLAPRCEAAGAVVGNPPFLGQLRARTAVDADRRRALRARYGDAVGAYTDPAWLFLLRSVEDVVPGGRVALVQPQSVLAARDAAGVRAAIDRQASLVDVLLPGAEAFDADVATCGVVLERGATGGRAWTDALADGAGVPTVDLPDGRVLGDLAATHAGFRDEYYAMAGAVAEGGPGRPLVTVGAIDPLTLLDRPQRFAGQRWGDPRVDVDGLDGRAARWAALQAGPKLLVATQTKVLEAVADPDGDLLGSVPAVVVVPRDPAQLWHLAAALHAPAASAWLLRRSAGTARTSDACRPTAALLAALPVPADGPAWDDAARAAEAARRGRGDVAEVARLADAALGVADPSVHAWWDARRPRR